MAIDIMDMIQILREHYARIFLKKDSVNLVIDANSYMIILVLDLNTQELESIIIIIISIIIIIILKIVIVIIIKEVIVV